MAVSDYLTQQQVEEMMNQRFGVPEGTPRSSPLDFQYQEEEYPDSISRSRLYNQREGMYSPKMQTQDPDAYYKNVQALQDDSRPRMGILDYKGPFSKPEDREWPYVEYEETADKPGGHSWQHNYGYWEDNPTLDYESDPMLMEALIRQKQSNLYGPNVYERAPLNERDLAGITAANAAKNIKTPPFQDFSFSEYQGPSVGDEAGNIYEQQEDEPWYTQMLGIAGAPFRWLDEKAKASKHYRAAPDWTPAYNQAGMPIQGYGYTGSALDKTNALGGYYSEPARAKRRADKRVEKMLERRALGKNYSAANLKELSGGQYDFGGGQQGSYTAPTKAAPKSQSSASSTGYMGPGGQHYSKGGIVSLL